MYIHEWLDQRVNLYDLSKFKLLKEYEKTTKLELIEFCWLKMLLIESRRRNTRDLGKASKRQSTGGVSGSPSWEKSNKPRKSSNKPKEESIPTRIPVSMDHPPPTLTVPDIPKKSRRHKPKENSSGRSSKLRSKAQPASESGSPTQFKSRINQGPLKKMDTVS